MRDIFKTLGINALLVAGGALLVFLYLTLVDIRDKDVGVSVESAPAREVRGKPTTAVAPPKGIQVHKPEVKANLKLPKAAQENANEQVVAATQVRPSERPQTVTTTVDMATGQFQTYTRLDPYPWFALERRGEVRLSVGYRVDGLEPPKPVVRLGVNYDVIRVKALTAGVTTTFDSDGRAFAGVGVAYRW